MFVFIDGSNYIFQRYHGIETWMKHAKKELTESERMLMYVRMFEEHLKKIKKKFAVPWENIYYALDSASWRFQHYTEYKNNRQSKLPNDVFPFTIDTLIPELKEKYGFNVVKHAQCEADDVIAIGVNYLRSAFPMADLTVLSSDKDFLQLWSQQCSVMNLNFKPLNQGMDERLLKNYLMYKIIRGDVSDNIPSIMAGIGEKRAEMLAQNREELEKILNTNTSAREQYMLNTLLIDFHSIPESLRIDVENLCFRV